MNNFPKIQAFDAPRFDFDEDMAYHFLHENGYVVIKNVISNDQIKEAISLLWDFLENLGTGIKRNDSSTWNNDNWIGNFQAGVISEYHIGQSKFLWYCRLLCKKIFVNLWKYIDHNINSNNLLTSFDGCGIMRSSFNEYKPITSWYHTALNPLMFPDLLSYQGFLNLLSCDENSGGLVIIPKSNNSLMNYCKTYIELTEKDIDYVDLSPIKMGFNDIQLRRWISSLDNPIKINCKAGDFVLWDSRTFHCNTCAISETEVLPNNNLERIVAYITMYPYDLIPEEDREKLISNRMDGFIKGKTTGHYPCFYQSIEYENLKNVNDKYECIEPNNDIINLISGKS